MDLKINAIVEIITEEWLKTKTPSKRNGYRKVVYIGLSMAKPGMTLKTVANDLDMSVSGVSKIHQRWESGKNTNPVFIEAIKLFKSEHNRKISKKMKELAPSIPKDDIEKVEIPASDEKTIKEIINPDPKRIVARSFGFEWTAEDMAKYHAAIRSAELWWKKYDTIGRKPRRDGDYYAPGTNPNIDNKEWVSSSSAVQYTGLSEQHLTELANKGLIERREYRRSANRSYYEYNLADLDKILSSPHKDIL